MSPSQARPDDDFEPDAIITSTLQAGRKVLMEGPVGFAPAGGRLPEPTTPGLEVRPMHCAFCPRPAVGRFAVTSCDERRDPKWVRSVEPLRTRCHAALGVSGSGRRGRQTGAIWYGLGAIDGTGARIAAMKGRLRK
jgi:hypothetical protein